MRVALDAPPDGWDLADPPTGMLAPGADDPADVIVAFFRAADEITDRLPTLARRIFPAARCGRYGRAGQPAHVSDITDNVVRSCALDLGLVDVKVAAVDENWSGLRLVWRTSNRVPGSSN